MLPLLGTIGGAAAGAFMGNPMLGASLGGMVGGLGESLIEGDTSGAGKQLAGAAMDPKIQKIIQSLLSGK